MLRFTLFLLSLSAALLLGTAQGEPVRTINMKVQAIAQAALNDITPEEGVWELVNSGMLIMDPKTGDILAMAERCIENEPSPLLSAYEPGNTFSLITAAAAVDSGAVTPEQSVNCERFLVPEGKMISDGHYNFGTLPLWGAVAKGSRPGAARIALETKLPVFHEYLTRFGFSSELSFSLVHAAYGEGIRVTPLQMTAFYAALANKGVRLEARLDKNAPPVAGTRVMSEETATALLRMLEQATHTDNPQPVRRGIAMRAAVPGYRIGAMTGASPRGGADKVCDLTCIALLPADNPQFVVFTRVLARQIPSAEDGSVIPLFGGTVAAPVFRAAAEQLLQEYKLQPTEDK